MDEPVFIILVTYPQHASDDVNHAEIWTFVKVDVLGAAISRENHADLPLFVEVNRVDIVTVEVEVVLLGNSKWLQKRTQPRDKRTRLTSEKVNFQVSLLVDEHWELDLQFWRQLLNEIMNLLHVLILAIVQRILDSGINLLRYIVIFSDLFKHIDLLTVSRILGIVVLDDLR